MRKYIFITIVLLFFIAFFAFFNTKNSTTPPGVSPTLTITISPGAGQPVLGARTKTTDCRAQNGLPDKDCTPGAILGATKEQICTPGYATSVRDVPAEEKQQVFAEYGIVTHEKGEYEVDHLISLELGGSNDIANLWPEAATPTPGFHQKDAVENYLHQQVCNGALTLQQAQNEISGDWLSIYSTVPH